MPIQLPNSQGAPWEVALGDTAPLCRVAHPDTGNLGHWPMGLGPALPTGHLKAQAARPNP